MKKYFTISIFLLLLLPIALLAQTKLQPPIKIALVGDLMPQTELGKIETLLKTFPNTTYSIVSIKDLDQVKLKNFTHLWIHKTIVNTPSQDEINSGKTITEFVKNGGNLFLSREAVTLLNTWQIETQLLQVETDTVRDDGFGRPIGFHSFKSHPLFAGMNGGVYPSKAKEDCIVRKIGFFGNTVPTNGKVAGIEWTYITFHENNKLLLEYSIGKGKIIAIGAFLDYEIPNFNSLQLNRFTQNVFLYTAGQITNEKKYFWEYDKQQVKEVSFKTSSQSLITSNKWTVPQLSIQLQREAATNDFVNLAGRRILIMGKERGGIEEIWVHPFMAMRDYRVEVLMKSGVRYDLNKLKPKIVLSPEMLIREYTDGDLNLKEIITLSFDKPMAVMHYEWSGNQIDKIAIQQTSNLRFMWPYAESATRNIEYSWLPNINGMLISGQNGELNSLTSFSIAPSKHLIGQFDSISGTSVNFKAFRTDKIQVNSAFEFNAADIKSQSLNVYFIAGSEGIPATLSQLKTQKSNFNELFLNANSYYKSLLTNYLVIQSPDSIFNEGYKWALLRTDQFLQETPGVGTSLMAGFGTTARGWDGNQTPNGRPGYAWYFGRDGQWSGLSIDAYGDFKMVKKELEVYNHYLDLSGKVYHELTSSGAVHYDAADASPLYLVLAAHYLKASGDLEFIHSIWPGLQKTFNYIMSTDTDGDGLIENTNVGHGWIEGGKLYGSHTEFYLAGCQAAAAEGMKYMALAMNEKDLASQYGQVAEKTKKIIDQTFWNSKTGFFNNGKLLDGSFMEDKTALAAVCVYLNTVTDPKKAFAVGSEFSGNGYTTDWGTRIISEFSPNYNAGAYHAGMVWPLFTGWTSLAEYATGCYTSGFLHLMQNINIYHDWALGSIEETLNGKTYKPNGVCALQCWSETMILQAAIEGMLGLKTDAMNNNLTLAPRFPWDWNRVQVSNIRMNQTLVDLQIEKTLQETSYLLTNKGKPVNLSFTPAFPLFTEIQSVELNGKSIPYTVKSLSESIELSINDFELPSGENKLVVKHLGGKSLLSPVIQAIQGQENTGVKVISQKADGVRLRVILNGKPDRSYMVHYYSVDPIKIIIGGRIIRREDAVTTIDVVMPPSKEKYVDTELIIK
jgi:glycogen debranching enzyme